jgi:hypothetical protein
VCSSDLKSTIDAYQCTILTPLPGTALFDRMTEQNRIVLNHYPSDWQHYHFMVATMNTPELNTVDMEAEMKRIWIDLYSKEAMRRKMFRTLWNTKNFTTAYWAYATNHNYGRMLLEDSSAAGSVTGYSGPAGKKLKHWLYLKVTDIILWAIYQLFWSRMIRRLSAG